VRAYLYAADTPTTSGLLILPHETLDIELKDWLDITGTRIRRRRKQRRLSRSPVMVADSSSSAWLTAAVTSRPFRSGLGFKSLVRYIALPTIDEATFVIGAKQHNTLLLRHFSDGGYRERREFLKSQRRRPARGEKRQFDGVDRELPGGHHDSQAQRAPIPKRG
jgi:hypothetical protein